MAKEQPILSLVIPVYNFAHSVRATLAACLQHFSALGTAWELIVVDDGSRDGTPELIRREFGQRPELTLVTGARNRGKGAAVLEGLRLARGRYRLFTDCDLAYPPSEAERVAEALAGGAQVAIANRRLAGGSREAGSGLAGRDFRRQCLGRLFNLLVRALLGLETLDTQAGLKGFRAEVVPYLGLAVCPGFAFDVELLVIARENRLSVAEVPVRCLTTQHGSTMRLARHGPGMLADLWRIYRRRRRGGYRL